MGPLSAACQSVELEVVPVSERSQNSGVGLKHLCQLHQLTVHSHIGSVQRASCRHPDKAAAVL